MAPPPQRPPPQRPPPQRLAGDDDDVRALLRLTGLRRYRNGLLALDYFGRRMERRWAQVRLDGQWYGRAALADWLRRRAERGLPPAVPHSGRPLSARDARAVLSSTWCC